MTDPVTAKVKPVPVSDQSLPMALLSLKGKAEVVTMTIILSTLALKCLCDLILYSSPAFSPTGPTTLLTQGLGSPVPLPGQSLSYLPHLL